MADRYFSDTAIEGRTATLTGGQAHHLLHVMRAVPGHQVVLFDGHGGEFQAEVIRCGRADVELAVGPRQDVERELPFPLTLAVSLPKAERRRWLVEKAVELGVARLVPMVTQRGGTDPGQRLSRYVIEASKQCGRNRLMEIAAPTEWDAVVQLAAGRRLVAHPGGQPLDEVQVRPLTDVLAAVGPEGGFTDQEIALATTAGWQVVNLGARILRVETAALALVAALTAP